VGSQTTFSLNAHATYACRHSGACCTAGWAIPVELPKRLLLGTDWLVPGRDGGCPQYDRSARRCRVHRDHGEPHLPESCRHFPRRAVTDSRGTSVNLSHFCPTAAALLFDWPGSLDIVSNPAAFPPDREYDGLEARHDWPPLLRPDALFDMESFSTWERFVVTTLDRSSDDVATALAAIAAYAERLRDWNVEQGSLVEWTGRMLAEPLCSGEAARASLRYRRLAELETYGQIRAMVPAGLAPADAPDRCHEADAEWVQPAWRNLAPLVLRYLAARSFGSWTAYQGRGIRTHIAELYATATVARVEAVRACVAAASSLSRRLLVEAVRSSDRLLVHLLDREQLVAWLGRIENDDDRFARA
jgi:hypothetical protein